MRGGRTLMRAADLLADTGVFPGREACAPDALPRPQV